MEALKKLLNNIADLFKVKTILSLLVIITTCYLTIKEIIDPATFMALASAIITYYFTRRTEENIEIDNKKMK